MDILWGIEQRLVSKQGKPVEIAPMHIWNNVIVKNPRQSIFRDGVQVIDIEHEGHIFKTIPCEWFLIQS